MRIFGLFADVTFTQKPAWLDDFRARYDEPYNYHLTLKQPCYIQKEKIPELKGEVQEFFSTQEIQGHRIDLVFDRLFIRPESPKGAYIMILAQENPVLMKFQRHLREALAQYQNYLTPESSQWERDFKPQITIARHLSPEQLKDARRDLHEDYRCVGSINEVYLQVVEEKNVGEANRQDNRTIFLL
jgi:2'-5' RNA ligase